MEHRLLVTRLPRILLCVALIAVGTLVAGTEMRALSFDENADAALPDRLLPGRAPDTKMTALMWCDHAMAEPAFGMMGAMTRKRTAAICADLSTAVRVDAPSHGFAHFIAAKAASAVDRPDRMANHLIASQTFARHEGWLAERRFLLLNQAGPELKQRLLPAEIATMLASESGARMLAGALDDPSLRDVVLDVATTAPVHLQQRLLTLVQRKAERT